MSALKPPPDGYKADATDRDVYNWAVLNDLEELDVAPYCDMGPRLRERYDRALRVAAYVAEVRRERMRRAAISPSYRR